MLPHCEKLAAIALYEAELPVVVVSDIGMPNEDGFALAKELRAGEARAEKPTVMIALTGFAGADDRREALEGGFNAHLAKPIDLDELAARIRMLVGKSQGQ